MLTWDDFCFQDDAFHQVALAFQATVEGLTASHERQINSLQQRLQITNDELKNTEIALIRNVTTNTVCPSPKNSSVVH